MEKKTTVDRLETVKKLNQMPDDVLLGFLLGLAARIGSASEPEAAPQQG